MLTTAPNLLTLGRIGLIPLLVGLFYVDGEWSPWLACLVFTVAATTDFVDGWLARSWQQQSAFGRWLDPIADKLLVVAAVLMLVGFDRAPLLPALVILLREIMVSGLREYMAEIKVGMPVSRLAKWKTAVQLVALGVLLLGDAGPSYLHLADVGEIGLWIAAILTLVTGWDYLQAGVGHMLAEGADRRATAKVNPAAPLR